MLLWLYMAPEMFRGGHQTTKSDIWSLFVTMLWTLDVGGFRFWSYQHQSAENAQEKVQLLATSAGEISEIQQMAFVNPEERASAAQMLVKCCRGEGLSTPRDKVPALICSPSPATAASPASHTSTTRIAQTNSRDLQNNANIFAVAAHQYRGGNAQNPR